MNQDWEIKLKDFRTLEVWEKSHRLVLAIYLATGSFPKEELFGLTTQIRRAAGSIPANIAEGCGRNTDADFARFLQIAMGSSSELEYHLLLARDLGFIASENHNQLEQKVQSVKQMLTALMRTLRAPSGGKRIADSGEPYDETES
jgi:four helix bundle protein